MKLQSQTTYFTFLRFVVGHFNDRCRISGLPWVGNVRKNFGGSVIMAVRRTPTGNRGEYLRVIGIHSDG